MNTLTLFLLATGSLSALEFTILSKQDVKEFNSAYQSIEEAFQEKNLSPIASFGPSILSRYSALLLQSDPWAKKQRGAYQKLDSMVAYAIVRLHVDSIKASHGAVNKTPTDIMAVQQMDRLLSALRPAAVLCVLDEPYCDSTRAQVHHFLEIQIPKLVALLKAQGNLDQAYQALNSLSFQSKSFQSTIRSMETAVEKAFRQAISSYDKETVLGFQTKYPSYKADKIRERLSSLEGDEIYHLLKSQNQTALIQFLQANPNSSYAPDARRILEPLLFKAAVVQFDLGACQTYLGLFPSQTPSWKKVSETLTWMTQPAVNTLLSTGASPTLANPALDPASSVFSPPDDGQDGPRTPPLPDGYSPLAGRELDRLGIGVPKKGPSQ